LASRCPEAQARAVTGPRCPSRTCEVRPPTRTPRMASRSQHWTVPRSQAAARTLLEPSAATAKPGPASPSRVASRRGAGRGRGGAGGGRGGVGGGGGGGRGRGGGGRARQRHRDGGQGPTHDAPRAGAAVRGSAPRRRPAARIG